MKCRPALQIFLSIIITFVLCGPLFAVNLDNLYNVAIQVTDSSATTRAQILPDAFEQVVLRAASSHHAITHQEYIKARQHIDEYLNTYFYTENAGTYTLTLKFNEQKLTALFNKMGRNSLNKNRPQVLLWLVTEQNDKYDFVTSASMDDVADKVDALANSYGLPVLLPLLDLAERQSITEADVINFNVAPLEKAAARYNADNIMIGNVKNVNGVWHCEWRLVDGTRNISWNTKGDDLNIELEVMFNQLADKLVASAHKMSTTSSTKQSIAVRVNGVDSIANYARVLAHLKKLPIVRQVEVGSVEGNWAMFLVTAEGGRDAVIKALHADHLLNAESEVNATLIYRVSS